MALLCHCRVVSDRCIEEAIVCGASTVDEVAEHCGAGARCGGCVPAIEDMLSKLAAALDGAAA